MLGDCTGDGFTDIDDLEVVVQHYGCGACTRCEGDLTGDGAVGQLDLGLCLADYCCGYTEFGCVQFQPPLPFEVFATEGTAIELFITAVGDPGPIVLRQAMLPTPPGGVFDPGIPDNPVTGVFTWTPLVGEAGTYRLFVSARHTLNGACCPILGSILIHVAAAPPPPAAPGDLRILPDYSGTKAAVLFFEDNANDETKFEIERKEGAGAYAKVHELAANDETVETTVEWTDTPLAADKVYTYRVRAVNDNGNSAYTNEAEVDFGTAWPTPEAEAAIEILHGFGDGLGLPAERMHHGIDIQHGDGGQDVRPARTALAFALVGTGDNRGVWLMYLKGGEIWHWHANHLDQIEANVAAVTYGTFQADRTLRSGVKIGRVTKTTWAAPWNHVHVQFNQNGVEGAGTWTKRLKNTANYKYDEDRFRHGLSIYTSEGQKDPKKKKPAPRDENGNSRTIEFNKASDGSDYGYDAATKPLAGDVDVAVELYDEMGTDPAQTVDVVKWWITPPKGADATRNAVRSTAKPYVLVAFSQNYMKDASWNVIYDSNRAANPAGYPWNNYHHYVLTNTRSDDGKPASLDAGQYWRTKAKQDDSDVEADTANMTGKPQAAKAEEARFPDGDYTLWVRMADLVNLTEEHKWESIRVDNYPPAVKKIEKAAPDGGPVPGGECPGALRLTFSEPVVHVEHADITLTDPNDQPVGVIYAGDPNDPTVVVVVFDVPLDGATQYKLNISTDVKDRYDNKLDSMFGDANHNGVGGEPDDAVAYAFCYCFLADLNGDGVVDQSDLGVLLGDFGCSGRPGECAGDINGDGLTGQSDLGLLLADFGKACP